MKRYLFIISILFLSIRTIQAESLTLQQAIDEALHNNPSIRESLISVQQSQIETGQAYSSLLPSVSASASGNGQKNSSQNSWISGWSMSGGINQSIYQPGLLTNIKISKIQESLAKTNSDDLASQVRQEIESAYYGILNSDALKVVYEENILADDENIRKIQAMYKLGIKTESDVLKSEVQKGEVESLLVNEQMNRTNQQRNLLTLLGREPNTEIALEKVDVEVIAVPDLKTAENTMLEKNRELIVLTQNRKVKQLNVQISRESFLPSISANYSIGKSGSGSTSSNLSNSIGISASIPIFDGFNKRKDVQKSKLDVDKIDLEITQLKQDLRKTLTSYYSNLETYNSLISIQEKNLSSAQKDLELVTRQYELGLVTILDQMNAQTSVLTAKSNLVKLKYSRKITESQIVQLIGN
ncbi:MAG: TolC family protein [Candidatus Marinimicrobia bacterium]|nr:TolC family protein [Candidatus Neomarinimicrobiota bacterium]